VLSQDPSKSFRREKKRVQNMREKVGGERVNLFTGQEHKEKERVQKNLRQLSHDRM